jgi:RNA polymerase sigma factor (sigma-70 family)
LTRDEEISVSELTRDFPEDEPEPTPDIVLVVRTALERLPEAERKVVELHDLDADCSYSEIGEQLHITPSAARVRHFRALRRLRGLIEADPRACNCLRHHGYH